ncbi:hypothetical protein D9M71_426430 [compost metagenome]
MLPCMAATLSGAPAAWVQAWPLNASPTAQGAINRAMPVARKAGRLRRRARFTSRAALSARAKDTSQTPPSGASPASGPSSWL